MQKIVLFFVLLLLSTQLVLAQDYKCTAQGESVNDYLIVRIGEDGATVEEYTNGELTETNQAEKLGPYEVQFTMSTPNGFEFKTVLNVADNEMTVEMEPYPASSIDVECEEL